MPGSFSVDAGSVPGDAAGEIVIVSALSYAWNNARRIHADIYEQENGTKVYRVQSIVLTKEGFTEVPPTKEGIRKMIHELIVDHTLG